MNHIYIFGTILFTVFGQIILKWRLTNLGFVLPESFPQIAWSLIKLVFDPFMLMGLGSAFLASMCWTAAMSKFDITYAYPFMSLSPAIVFLVGTLFLNEAFTWGKLFGLIIIMIGIIVTVKF